MTTSHGPPETITDTPIKTAQVTSTDGPTDSLSLNQTGSVDSSATDSAAEAYTRLHASSSNGPTLYDSGKSNASLQPSDTILPPVDDSYEASTTAVPSLQSPNTNVLPAHNSIDAIQDVDPDVGAHAAAAVLPESQDDGSSTHGSFIVADDFDDDEGYARSTNTSYVSSLASNIRRGVEENGRIYASYGRNEYGMPIDESAQEHNDLNHAKFCLLMSNRLFLAPIGPEPQNILDIGTGSGIWAIDMADMFPSAQVTGTDIAPIQPGWVPPNCQFEIEDAEDDWLFAPESYDFIHARELLMSIRDWPRFISQSYARLKPGGWLELAMTNPRTCCDDGSLDLATSRYVESAKIFFEMAAAMGTPLDAPNSWKEQMEANGFEDVQEVFIKLPMGPWAKDRRLKQVGMFELKSLNDGFEGYLIRGFTQFLKRPAEELRALLAYARKEINDPKNHSYVHFIVVYGRKPGGDPIPPSQPY